MEKKGTEASQALPGSEEVLADGATKALKEPKANEVTEDCEVIRVRQASITHNEDPGVQRVKLDQWENQDQMGQRVPLVQLENLVVSAEEGPQDPKVPKRLRVSKESWESRVHEGHRVLLARLALQA